MKLFEKLRPYLDGKITTCLRCGFDLSEVPTKFQTSPEIECPICGLIVELTSRRNRQVNLCFAVAILAGSIGFFVGSLL